MRILIISDTHGVADATAGSLRWVAADLEGSGHKVALITPDQFAGSARWLALAAGIGNRIAATGAEAIHIATRGPLGLAARRWCLRHGFPFTATCSADHAGNRRGLRAAVLRSYIRWFRAPAQLVFPAIPAMVEAPGPHWHQPWWRASDLAAAEAA